MQDAVNKTGAGLRKANECFQGSCDTLVPRLFFDEFWREGELALMFGPAGTGKSILAMQVADAIARGRPIDGFQMPVSGARVLYVDTAVSEKRFRKRYSVSTGASLTNPRFSERLYRQTPPPKKEIGTWLREVITENAIKAVILDDLNSLSKTADGTRETLPVMRDLRKICDEMNVAILAITTSRSGAIRPFSEAELMRSRVLCDVADSVFAVGYNPQNTYQRLLVQLRSWSAPLRWTLQNAPVALIARSHEDGFLRFVFDKRFVKRLSEEKRRLIQEIKWRVDAGATYHEIAEELGISKTRAHGLRKLWTPDMEPPREIAAEPEARIIDHFDGEPDDYRSEIGMDADIADNLEAPMQREPATEFGASACSTNGTSRPDPFAAMKRSLDRRGSRIFIEKEDENGRPTVWYGYNKAGRFSRFERTCVGINIYPYDGMALPP